MPSTPHGAEVRNGSDNEARADCHHENVVGNADVPMACWRGRKLPGSTPGSGWKTTAAGTFQRLEQRVAAKGLSQD